MLRGKISVSEPIRGRVRLGGFYRWSWAYLLWKQLYNFFCNSDGGLSKDWKKITWWCHEAWGFLLGLQTVYVRFNRSGDLGVIIGLKCGHCRILCFWSLTHIWNKVRVYQPLLLQFPSSYQFFTGFFSVSNLVVFDVSPLMVWIV